MMNTKVQSRPLGPLSWPVYTVALIMLVMPLLDAAAAIGTFSPTMYRWRFGAMGILSTNIITPLFGLLLALIAAYLQRNRWVLHILTGLTFLAAVVLAGMMAMFVLDGLQMRAELEPQVRPAFLLIAGKSLLSQALALLGLGTVCLGSRRASGGIASPGRAGRSANSDLVVATATSR
jgi:hypothetical protein